MSCCVTGNAAVREVKLYFTVKGVFFSCQQPWLHQPLLDSPSPTPSYSLPFFLVPIFSLPYFCLLCEAVQDRLGALFLSLHAVILKVPLCSCFQDKFKNIFLRLHSKSQTPAVVSLTAQTLPLYPAHRTTYTPTLSSLTYTIIFLCFLLRLCFFLEC